MSGRRVRLTGMIAGNFSVFPFLSVLQMLMSSGRTGVLEVQDQSFEGFLWLREGTIVHARAGQLEGESGMQLLTTIEDGQFHFESLPEVTAGESLDLSGDLALRQLFQDTEAWKPLLAEYGDWSRAFAFTDKWNDRFSVNRQQFQVLRGVERGLSISQMIDEAGLPPRLLLGSLKQFEQAGYIR